MSLFVLPSCPSEQRVCRAVDRRTRVVCLEGHAASRQAAACRHGRRLQRSSASPQTHRRTVRLASKMVRYAERTARHATHAQVLRLTRRTNPPRGNGNQRVGVPGREKRTGGQQGSAAGQRHAALKPRSQRGNAARTARAASAGYKKASRPAPPVPATAGEGLLPKFAFARRQTAFTPGRQPEEGVLPAYGSSPPAGSLPHSAASARRQSAQTGRRLKRHQSSVGV